MHPVSKYLSSQPNLTGNTLVAGALIVLDILKKTQSTPPTLLYSLIHWVTAPDHVLSKGQKRGYGGDTPSFRTKKIPHSHWFILIT